MKWTTVGVVGSRSVEARLRKALRLPLRPYKLLLELTAECNSRCVSCAIWKTPAAIKRQEFDLSHVERMFRASGKDIVWLAISGGEVTVYEDFPSVIELVKRFCPKLRVLTFTTNGLLPQKALEWALLIKNAGYDCFITISLDGDEAVHDRIRGVQGNYALAMDTLALLRKNGINAQFGLTVGDTNESFIARQYWQRRAEIKAVTFTHSDGIYAQENRVDDGSIVRSLRSIYRSYDVRGVGDLLEKMYVKLGIAFVAQHRAVNMIPCGVGHTSLHVRPGGDVLHCMFLEPIGNIKESGSLREMVNSAESKEKLAQIARDKCPHCWMNCYAPHSMLMNPLKTAYELLVNRTVGEGARRSEASSTMRAPREPGRERPLRVVTGRARNGQRRLPLVGPSAPRDAYDAAGLARDTIESSDVR